MNPGIFAALASATTYSVSNYIDKFLLENQKLNYFVITIYSGFFGFIIGLIISFFVGFYTQDIKTIILIILSGFFINISLLPYYKALSFDETSRIIPLFLLIPVFVLILSYLLLGEVLSFQQYLGSFLIIIASFLISMEEIGYKIFKLRSSLWLMMFSCLLYSLALIIYKFGIKELPFFQSLFYEGIGMLICSFTILIGGNKKHFLREFKKMKVKVYSYITLNEAVNLLAIYFYYFSLTIIGAGLASVLMQGIQPFITLFFGILLTIFFPHVIKESLDKKNLFIKFGCMLVMFLGLYLIFF